MTRSGIMLTKYRTSEASRLGTTSSAGGPLPGRRSLSAHSSSARRSSRRRAPARRRTARRPRRSLSGPVQEERRAWRWTRRLHQQKKHIVRDVMSISTHSSVRAALQAVRESSLTMRSIRDQHAAKASSPSINLICDTTTPDPDLWVSSAPRGGIACAQVAVQVALLCKRS